MALGRRGGFDFWRAGRLFAFLANVVATSLGRSAPAAIARGWLQAGQEALRAVRMGMTVEAKMPTNGLQDRRDAGWVGEVTRRLLLDGEQSGQPQPQQRPVEFGSRVGRGVAAEFATFERRFHRSKIAFDSPPFSIDSLGLLRGQPGTVHDRGG